MSLDKIVNEKGKEWKQLFETMSNYVKSNKELLNELHHGTLLAVTINSDTGESLVIDNGSSPYLKERIKDIGDRYPQYKVFIITDGQTYEGFAKKPK